MHSLRTVPRLVSLPALDFAFLAEPSAHPLADLASFAHAAAAHAWRCRVVTRQLEGRLRPVKDGGSPILPEVNRTGDRWACVTCCRGWSKYQNRMCPLCQEHAGLYGIKGFYAGGENEYVASGLSAAGYEGADSKAFEYATVEDTDITIDDDLRRHALAGNPLRAKICQAYIQAKGDVSKTARMVKRDRKTVRHHIRPYRERLDELIADPESKPSAGRSSDGHALVSRAVLYAYGSDGKRHPRPTNEFDVRCNACGIKQRYCTGKCCPDCWHPRYCRPRVTRFYTSRG